MAASGLVASTLSSDHFASENESGGIIKTSVLNIRYLNYFIQIPVTNTSILKPVEIF